MRTRWLFLTAGLIYVVGVLGLELVGGRQLDLTGEQRTVMYVALGAVEELLEMVGIVVFMYALMSYIAVELATLRLGIAASGVPPLSTRALAGAWSMVVLTIITDSPRYILDRLIQPRFTPP